MTTIQEQIGSFTRFASQEVRSGSTADIDELESLTTYPLGCGLAPENDDHKPEIARGSFAHGTVIPTG